MNSAHASRSDKAPMSAVEIETVLDRLGPSFSEQAALLDAGHGSLRDNISRLKQAGLMGAGVPTCLGGGGANHAMLCRLAQRLAQYCSATGLVMAMHCHQVSILSRLASGSTRIQNLLRGVASDSLMLLSSGGSDWLNSSGIATRVDGGYIISARKSFSSGSEVGDILMSSAVDRSASPATVIHFAVPMTDVAITIEHTWQTLGMRGTGSQDVIISDLFVPDADIIGRRQSGAWSRINHLTAMLAFPIIYAAYLGIAEAIRMLLVSSMSSHAPSEHKLTALGEIEMRLHAARIAHRDMVQAASDGVEGFATTNRVMIGRGLVEREALAVADGAMSLLGGRAFYNRTGLERLFRDIQAARFHPLTTHPQRMLAGRMALGLTPEDAEGKTA